MTSPARVRRFLRLLVAPGSMVWHIPVRFRSPVDAHNVRHAWRRSDPEYVDKLIERFRASDEHRSESRPLSPPGVWQAYCGRVTARTGGRGIRLDDAGELGTDLDDWLLAILGIDAYAGGRTRARLVAEVTEPTDRADPSVGQERLRLLGVAAEQRPPDGGPADLLIRARAAYAIPGEAHPQTAVVWAVTADPALDGLSPIEWVDAGRDPERLLTIARQDGARMAW
jgi:hypothetical protein